MANHVYGYVDVQPLSENGINPKLYDFIKENNLPFEIEGWIEKDKVIITGLSQQWETRRQWVLSGKMFGDEEVESLYPFLKDAIITTHYRVECHGGETHVSIVRDGKNVVNYTIEEEMQTDRMMSGPIYTPKGQINGHLWDNEERVGRASWSVDDDIVHVDRHPNDELISRSSITFKKKKFQKVWISGDDTKLKNIKNLLHKEVNAYNEALLFCGLPQIDNNDVIESENLPF